MHHINDVKSSVYFVIQNMIVKEASLVDDPF